MRWKSTNIWYLAGLGVPLLAAAALAVKAWPTVWVILTVLIALVLSFRLLISKTLALPHPVRAYGELKPLALTLPKDYGVELYTCEAMAKYDFILRVAELLSPVKFSGKPPKIAVNPSLIKEKGESFMQVAVVREIIRSRGAYQVRSVLRLALPLLLAAVCVLAVFAYDIPVSEYMNPFIFQFALPFLCTALFAGHLFLWNRSLSKQDFKLDAYLLTVFTEDEVRSYIKVMDELERKGEKQKSAAFSDHYLKERLEKLGRK